MLENRDYIKIKLPHFGIQCDWEDSIKQKNGSIWVTLRRENEDASIHGTIKSEGHALNSSQPFTTKYLSSIKTVISVKDTVSDYTCNFVAPSSVLSGIHKKGVVSFDVSEGGIGISACQDNNLKIWSTESGIVQRSLSGHVGDVYTCRLFPSGIVALTGGADMVLKIWSAETGQCPVTLVGHTGAILDTCIVDRGRNIISVGKDGKAILWDCGESKALGTIADCGKSYINACTLLSPSISTSFGEPSSKISEREVGTSGKLLVLGREDSKLQGFGVQARKELFNVTLSSAVNAVATVGMNTFAAGCQDGKIFTFDLRKIVQPKEVTFTTTSPILHILPHPRSPSSNPNVDEGSKLFWVSKNDGTVALLNPATNSDKPTKELVQLTGSDCDPVYDLKHDGNFIYAASRDGKIRKYSINNIMKASS